MFDATDPDDKKIHMTDGNNFISIKVNFSSDKDDKFLVSYPELFNYVKLLPDAPIELNHNPSKLITVVSFNKKEKAEISSDSPDDFLFALGQVSGSPEISVIVDTNHLKKAVDMAYQFVAKDEIGGLLYCHLKFDGESMNVISSNRHVLSQYTIHAKSNEGSILVGEEFKRLAKALSGDASIVIHDRKYRVFDDHIDFFASHVDEKYPDTAPFMKYPLSFIKVDREELLNVVKKAEVFSNKESRRATFQINKGKLKISSMDIATNKSYDTKITCVNSGVREPFLIWFNLFYMNQCLDLYDESSIRIHMFNDHTKAGYILGEDKNKFVLIMPMIPVEEEDDSNTEQP